jgi:hypothetical protein
MDLTMNDIYSNKISDFIINFGYYSKKINREEVPEFINYALSFNDKYIYDKIYNELNFYMVKCRKHELGYLISNLCNYSSFENELINNFTFWRKLIVPTNVLLILQVLMRNSNNYEVIVNNLGSFLENVNNDELEKKVLELLEKIPQVKSIIEQLKHQRKNLGEYSFLLKLNIGTFYHIIQYSLLDEIKKYFALFSNDDLKKVDFLANGSTSSVFFINIENGYIIKIGKERFTFNSQFSKYLLQPYVRKEYKNSNNNTICTIEIQDFCLKSEISDQELEWIYEKLLQDGCIWLDKDKTNICRLLQENTRKISKELDGFDYDNAVSQEPIGQAGDMIIIDNDLILSLEKCQERHSVYNVVSNDIDVTIIVDCNLDNNLRRVFNNILNQTFDDYEVICINGNDISKQIVNEYLKLDNRFKSGVTLHSSNNVILYDSQSFLNPYYLSSQIQSITMEENASNHVLIKEKV